MHTIVVGAGMVGQNLAEDLTSQGYGVTIIDLHTRALERASEALDVQTVHGHGADTEVLTRAGVAGAELFMAVTDRDEINLLACLAAKELGALLTVARVANPVYLGGRRALYRNLMGVDIVVSPENLTAIEIAKHARAAGVVAIEQITGGRLGIREVEATTKQVGQGKPLHELNVPGYLVALIMREGQAVIPRGDEIIHPGDGVFVMGPTKDLGEAAKRIGPEIGNATRAIIVGGGDIGRMAAESLLDLHVDVRLIERDRERSQELSESMSRAEVLLGDGTNVRLLREAGIETIDLFVAAAGEDELNLVMGMLAGELGAKKRVVIVKRQDFRRIVDRLGVDASISPRQMTANAIMRYIRRGRFTTLATVGDNHAEMLDTVVTGNTPAVGRSLSEIELPKGVLVGAITRGQKTIVPRGDSVFEPGDNVILLAEPDAIGDLEKIF